jgi:hypothetical protein
MKDIDTFVGRTALAVVAFFVLLVLLATPGHAQTSGGVPANLALKSLRVNVPTGSGCTVAGSLCIGSGTSTVTTQFSADGSASLASGNWVFSSTGTIDGGGRITNRNGTSGEWMRFNSDIGTHGYLNFRNNNVIFGLIGSTGATIGGSGDDLSIFSGTSKLYYTAASFPTIAFYDQSQSSNSRVWALRSNATAFWIAPSDDSLGSFSSKVLQASRSGTNVTDVTLSAGTATNNLLDLSGYRANLSASVGAINLSSGTDTNIIAGGNTLLDCTTNGCTSTVLSLGATSHSVLKANTAGGSADVLADNVNIDDHASAHAAVVKINNKLVCLADGTNCPGFATKTWQDVTGSRSLGSTFTNSSGTEIQVFVTLNYDIGGAGTATCTLDIGALTAVKLGATTSAAGAVNQTHTFNVPDGVAYKVNDVLNCALQQWVELRP